MFSESKYVKNTYNLIAEHFSRTRYKPWPEIENFLKNLDSGFICEIGCGNGKNFCNNKHIYIGGDISIKMLEHCRNANDKILLSGINLPFTTNSFDGVMSIAVLHHLNTIKRRKKFLEELIRITKPGGSLLLSVWAHESKDQKRSNQDGLIKWEKRDKTKYFRYYHLFTYNEVYKLLIQVKNIESFNIWYSNENFFFKMIKSL